MKSYAILEEDGCVMGQPSELVELALEMDILWECKDPDQCPFPQSQHKGEGFVHFAEGKGWDDYDELEAWQ